MYIHRVAIDVNRVNARGQLPAMNELEQMHDACLIEIVCTSTMTTDLHGKGEWAERRKAKVSRYDPIYADGVFYLTEEHVPDGMPGPVLRKSRFFEIYASIFGNPQPQQSASQLRNLRDALHIDQCWSNMVDYFVTGEAALRGCPNIDFVICDAPECVERLRGYFHDSMGTDDIRLMTIRFSESKFPRGK
jgi:hypothetical protein